MTETPTDQVEGRACLCQADHRPAVLEPQSHHLWPVYLGGPPARATMLWLCPTTHTTVHRCLRAMVRAGRVLSRDELREPGRPRPPHYAWATACNGLLAWQASLEPGPAAP